MKVLIVGSCKNRVDYEQGDHAQLADADFLRATGQLGAAIADSNHYPTVTSAFGTTADYGVVRGMNDAGDRPPDDRLGVRVVRDQADQLDSSRPTFCEDDFPNVEFHWALEFFDPALFPDRRGVKQRLYRVALEEVEGVILVGGSYNSVTAVQQAVDMAIPWVAIGALGGAGAIWLTRLTAAQTDPEVRRLVPRFRTTWDERSAPAVLRCLEVLRDSGLYPDRLPQAFISYSQDSAVRAALAIERALQARPAVRPWRDSTGLPDAERLDKILEIVDASEVFVAVIDDGWHSSPWCQRELERAKEGGCAIVALLLEGEIPEGVDMKVIEMGDGGLRQAVERVADAVERLARRSRREPTSTG